MKNETKAFGLAGLALVLANVASLLGSVQQIREQLYSLLGLRGLDFLHHNMAAVVAILLAGGYGFFYYRAHLRLRRVRSRPVHRVAVAVVLAAFFSLNVWAVTPREPTRCEFVAAATESWTDQAATLVHANGLLRTVPGHPDSPPQVWTTAQYMKAMVSANPIMTVERARWLKNAFAAIDASQLADPAEGWGYQLDYQWGVTEVAAWVALARMAALDHEASEAIWTPEEQAQATQRVVGDLALIAGRQLPDGSWSPISGPRAPGYSRAYSTLMALWALTEARLSPTIRPLIRQQFNTHIEAGARWVLNNIASEGGLQVAPGVPREEHPGLNAQAIFVLMRTAEQFGFVRSHSKFEAAVERFLSRRRDLLGRPVDDNSRMHDSAIYLAGAGRNIEPMTFLWYPWSLLAARSIAKAPNMRREEQDEAAELEYGLLQRVGEMKRFSEGEASYVSAEALLGSAFQCSCLKKEA